MVDDYMRDSTGTVLFCNFQTLSCRWKKWIEAYGMCNVCKRKLEKDTFCCQESSEYQIWIDNSDYEEFQKLFFDEKRRERSRRSSETRRYREKIAEGVFKKEDVESIYRIQGGKCYYCKDNLRDAFDIEHIIPLSKNGTHWPSNLSLACKTCNRKKGNMDLKKFWPIARKMYGDERISLSQKENRRQKAPKNRLTEIRRRELRE